MGFKKDHSSERYFFRMTGPVVFSNWVKLADEISHLGRDKKVILDFSDAILVDHATIEQIERLKGRGYSVDHLEVIFHPHHEKISGHHLSARVRRFK